MGGHVSGSHYSEDNRGLYRIVDGQIFRPLDLQEGRVVVDNSKLIATRTSSQHRKVEETTDVTDTVLYENYLKLVMAILDSTINPDYLRTPCGIAWAESIGVDPKQRFELKAIGTRLEYKLYAPYKTCSECERKYSRH
ncbi:MAG: hypothetical protein HYW24_02210 [Candidatus Aenigmarchaeota archaeon]|nr:hypothetical protein [Candidatus Aenigmarchaeota archaeon]